MIEPMILHIFPNTWYYDFLSVRVQPDNLAGTLAALEDSWTRYNPDRPFEYTFLDDQFDALYRSEARLGTLVAIFAGLAMFVACMGLFGLATFTVAQRTKEVGVRKVLGASVFGIVGLLSRELLKLTAVAFVVSAPLAYAAMQGWLSGFAYRIDLSWGSFIGAGLLALAIALLTVSYHAIRAATADPVNSLRYE
jgi:putative ABC transport system permease protein